MKKVKILTALGGTDAAVSRQPVGLVENCASSTKAQFSVRKKTPRKVFFCAAIIGFALAGTAFAVDYCIYYSTNPADGERGGLYAQVSGGSITVESSIREPVKITSIKLTQKKSNGKESTDEYVWDVEGNKRIGDRGTARLSFSPVATSKYSVAVIKAESCD